MLSTLFTIIWLGSVALATTEPSGHCPKRLKRGELIGAETSQVAVDGALISSQITATITAMRKVKVRRTGMITHLQIMRPGLLPKLAPRAMKAVQNLWQISLRFHTMFSHRLALVRSSSLPSPSPISQPSSPLQLISCNRLLMRRRTAERSAFIRCLGLHQLLILHLLPHQPGPATRLRRLSPSQSPASTRKLCVALRSVLTLWRLPPKQLPCRFGQQMRQRAHIQKIILKASPIMLTPRPLPYGHNRTLLLEVIRLKGVRGR